MYNKLMKSPAKNTVFLFALCFFFLFSACKTLPKMQEPVISLDSIELAGIDYTGVKLLCKVQIDNPNDFEIPYPQISWEAFIGKDSFTSGQTSENSNIEAQKTAIAEIPVSLEYLDIFNSFPLLKGTVQTDYRLDLALKFNIPELKNRVWNLQAEGIFPMLKAPVIGASIMRVEKIDPSAVEWFVSVNLENPNDFELPPPRHSFIYEINYTPFIRRTVTNRMPIAPSSSEPVIFGLLVYYVDVWRVFPELWVSGDIPSRLNLTFDFFIPAFSDDKFDLEIQAELPRYQ